jgi:hypothetical protein
MKILFIIISNLLIINFCYAQNNNNTNISSFKTNSKNSQSKLKESNFSQIVVNSKIISQTEINQRLFFIYHISKIKSTNKQNYSWQKIVAIRLIEEELIRQKSDFYKIKIDSEQINLHLENYAIKYFKNYQNFKNFIKNNRLNIENFYKQMETEIIWNKILEEVIKPSVSVSLIEIKEWLEKDKINKNNQKYLFKDYLIAPKSSSKEMVNKFYQEIKQKSDFIKILKNLLNPTNKGDNTNNWLWSSEINPQILAKIKSLNINAFSEPVLLDDGYHIFEIIDKRTDLDMTNQEIDFIRNQIFARKFEMAIKLYLQDLKNRAFIEYIQ